MPTTKNDHVCTDQCPRPDMSDLPDTDDALRALAGPRPGSRLVLVCHPIEADYVAAAVEEQLGACDLVRCETRNAEGVTVHSDATAPASVHATARVPAGKLFTWQAETVSAADRERWTNAPGATPAPATPATSPDSPAPTSGRSRGTPPVASAQAAFAF